MKDWQKITQDLQLFMKRKEPQIKVRDVQELFGLSSTSSAEYYLTKLEEMGAVRRVGNGKTNLWFLNWTKQ